MYKTFDHAGEENINNSNAKSSDHTVEEIIYNSNKADHAQFA